MIPTLSVAQLLIMSTMFLTAIGFGVILPALPIFAETLGATSFEMGLAMSMFALSHIFSSSIWGALSDRIGRKPVLISGVIGYGIISSMIAFSPNVPVLLILRFLGGMMSSAVMPSSLALLADNSTVEERPRIFGIMGSVNSIGFILGPLVGSFLGLYGIHVPFVSVGILAIINGILAFRLLPDGELPDKRKHLSELPKQERPTIINRLIMAISDKQISPLLLGAFALALVDSSISVTIAFFITGPLQSTQTMSGFAFVVNATFSAVTQSLFFSRLFERAGDYVTLVTGLGLSTIGYFVLGSSVSLVTAFAGLAILSMGRGFAHPAVSTGISLRTPAERHGSSFGAQQTVSSVARTIGPLIAGSLFLHYEQNSYYFSVGFLLLAIGFYMVLIKKINKKEKQIVKTELSETQEQRKGEST